MSLIHGLANYSEFQVDVGYFPLYLSFIPFVYAIPTLYAIISVVMVLMKSSSKKDTSIKIHVFLIISIYEIVDFIYFIADFFMFRLPTSGLVTSWCAKTVPNHFLKMILLITYHLQISTLIFPFLLSVLRLIIILYPSAHYTINSRLLKYGFTFIALYPFSATFLLFPALGNCKQAGYPFPFGSIWIHFQDSVFDLRMGKFLLPNVIFWLCACISINAVLFTKVIMAKNSKSLLRSRTNQKSIKGEISLTLTTISMSISFILTGIMVSSNFLFPSYVYYTIMLRPFGNDFELVVVSWVFYLTHPVFKKSRKDSGGTQKVNPSR